MRTVIVGTDGVPYEMMKRLSDKGVMPNFKALREDGILKKMESSIPEISSVAWSSVITGKNPGEHNIFGFTELIDNTYSLRFPNFSDLKAEPFWNDRKSVIINVPSTYPAQALDGFLVSGFVSLDLKKAVYPQSYVPRLEKMRYKIDVDSEKGHKSKLLFLKDLFDTLDTRAKVGNHMWDEFKWDIFMFVITGSDRLMHFLYHAYDNDEHKHHEDFLRYFQKVDGVIGNIVNKMGPDDRIFMLSDHGFEGLEYNVNVNTVLERHGLLVTGEEKKKRYNNIRKGTKVFALDPGRIYVHTKDRYPRGGVANKQDVLDRVIDIFKNLEHAGERVIKKVFTRDELYKGPYADKGPDLVLLANKGFNLKGTIGKPDIFTKDVFTGKHTQANAYLLANNDAGVPKNPSVFDFVDIIGVKNA